MSKAHSPGTISVSGTGLVKVAPDEAIVRLSVFTEAKTAVEASQSNATATEAVIEATSAQPNHGVTTSGLNVRPITQYDDGVATIVGFRATNNVEIRTKVGYAGQVFDAGIAAGANQSSGIEFRLQDDRPQRDTALQIAVKEAVADASIVASTAGVELDGPESIDVDQGGGRTIQPALLRAETTTPVMPNDLTVSATVRIVFRTTCK